MTHVLVTGAAGQLGRTVVGDLIAANYIITAVSHTAERLSTLGSLGNKERLNLKACDLADTNATTKLANVLDTVNVIIHIANGPQMDTYDHAACTEQVIMSINLIGIFGNQIDHAIVGSCTSVYGNTEEGIVEENHSTFPISYHGASLLAGEKFWNLFATNSGKPVTCLRFAPFVPRIIDSISQLTANENKKLTDDIDSAQKPSGGINYAEASQVILNVLKTSRSGIFNVYSER